MRLENAESPLTILKLLWLTLTSISAALLLFLALANDKFILKISGWLSVPHTHGKSCIFCGMTSAGLSLKNLNIIEAAKDSLLFVILIALTLLSSSAIAFTYLNKRIRRKLWQF